MSTHVFAPSRTQLHMPNCTDIHLNSIQTTYHAAINSGNKMRSFHAIGTLRTAWDNMARVAFLDSCNCRNCGKPHIVKAGMLPEWELLKAKCWVFQVQKDVGREFVLPVLISDMHVFFREYLLKARNTPCPGSDLN